MAEAYGLGDPNDSDRASSPGSAITGRHTAVGSRSCCVPAVRRRPGREPAVARCGSARSGQVQREPQPPRRSGKRHDRSPWGPCDRIRGRVSREHADQRRGAMLVPLIAAVNSALSRSLLTLMISEDR
jgi:hypothetical protein